MAHTLRASFGRPNPLLAYLWGQSKNTELLIDTFYRIACIFTLTPYIQILI